VGELEALVARNPLRERPWGQLMLARYRSGRQAEALAAYRALRELLATELGIEPSAAVRDLERRMLQQDPTLDLVLQRGPTLDLVAGRTPRHVAVVPQRGPSARPRRSTYRVARRSSCPAHAFA
jgi:DNA-binding SARP family transcriptional activator